MPSFSEIAKHLGVSQPCVRKYCKQGCPKDLEGAADWVSKRQLKRAPTTGLRAGNKSGVVAVPAQPKPKAEPTRKPESEPPQEPRSPAPTDTLSSALEAAIMVSDRCHQRVIRALEDDDKVRDLSPLFSVHSKALESRFKAERTYREELERRNLLIPFDQATEMFRRGFDFLLSRMKRIPQTHAPRCNPSNPLLALGVLDLAINGVIEDAQREYAAQ